MKAEIEALWESRASIGPETTGSAREAVMAALALLDSGAARVAEPSPQGWVVNEWLKKAVLLSFRLSDSTPMATAAGAYDKVPLKFAGWDEQRFRAAGVRVVPGAVVRRSAYVAPGVVLDFDADGHLVGIDIQHASRIVNLTRLEVESLPLSQIALIGPRVPAPVG